MAKRTRVSARILTTAKQIQLDAAWELLDAIRQLFPEKIAELEALSSQYPDIDEEDEDDFAFWKWLEEPVAEWARRNHISCDAVERVAWEYAAQLSDGSPDDPRLAVYFDEGGKLIKLPSITPVPHHETLEAFRERATQHYREIENYLVRRGFNRREKINRQTEHFKYLAAHLVGGFSLLKIANGETRLNLSSGPPSTVAEGAHEAAKLIGLPWPDKPGPRPGSKMPRKRRRPRRP